MGRLADAIMANIVKDYDIVPNKIYFLDPVDGVTTGDGSFQAPFKTLAAAYAVCVADKNDCIVWIGKNNNSKVELSEAFTWAKSATHLLGYCAPVKEGKRCRITQLSTATGITSMFTVSASNCVFSNIRFNQGVDDATSLVNVNVTGERNYFDNCEFAGIGHATMSATGSASLKIDGGSENTFVDCVIGLDTIARDADATEILLDSNATRNHFLNCKIKSYISAAGFLSVKIADNQGVDRDVTFENCMFMTDSVNKGVTQTAVFSIPAMSQGAVILKNTTRKTDGASGAGVWESSGRGMIWNNSVAAAASGVGGVMSKL